jgi:hypothetical protein
MMSEIYILRLEAVLRASSAPATSSSDTRFVPIKLSARSAKDAQPAGK